MAASSSSISPDPLPVATSQAGVDDDQRITPFEVISKNGVDYKKLTRDFGCSAIDAELIARFERVTCVEAHPWLRRGLFFSHKDLDVILDCYERGESIYLYTGRGPTSEAMHLGHMIPFMFSQYLQHALQAVIVIQMSDDEKFFFKEGKLEEFHRLSFENARDIIACGYDPDRTFLFSNLDTVGASLYAMVVRLMKDTRGKDVQAIFGLGLENNVGEIAWPCFQAAPAFSQAFDSIIDLSEEAKSLTTKSTDSFTRMHAAGTTGIHCLVPMAIDQAPYFRMARDFAGRSQGVYLKPAEIHSEFLVGLGGIQSKMSSSLPKDLDPTAIKKITPTIFLTDSPEVIRQKIITGAFSGGGETLKLHQEQGGNLRIDVPYQWLLYFENSDEKLAAIARDYSSGRMSTKEIKAILIETVQQFVKKHQEVRTLISSEVVSHFFSRRPLNIHRAPRTPLPPREYSTPVGIDFDRYFGVYK